MKYKCDSTNFSQPNIHLLSTWQVSMRLHLLHLSSPGTGSRSLHPCASTWKTLQQPGPGQSSSGRRAGDAETDGAGSQRQQVLQSHTSTPAWPLMTDAQPEQTHKVPSIQPFSSAYPGPGRGGSCLSRDTQTSLSPDTSSSSSGRIPRRSQASQVT